MMALAKLTDSDDDPLYVNPAKVLAVGVSKGTTFVLLEDENEWDVKGTPEQVADAINRAEKFR